MSTLIISYPRCKIQDEDDKGFLWALDKDLSYEIPGAKYSQAFQGKWDGKKHLLTKAGTFPTGLRNRVIQFYKSSNKELEIVDKRAPKTKNNPIDISANLSNMGIKPRDYQVEAAKVTWNNDCGIVRLPTGSGKSLLSALMTAQFGKNTIIYVIGKDLLYQFHGLFEKVFYPRKIGMVGDGVCEIEDITIASVWTVGKALEMKNNQILIESDNDEKSVSETKYDNIKKMLSDAKVHIIDECHVSSCGTIQELGKYIKPEHIYGMSASPWRDDNSDLLIEGILGDRIIDISATRLIREGYLVQPIIKFIEVPKYHEKINKQYQTIYKTYITENDVRNNIVLDETKKLVAKGYKPLVLYNSLNHGKILYELLSQNLNCVLLSGKDSNELRNNAKKEIEGNKLDVIIASKIFDIGVDIPALSALVVASSGKSSVRALQRIGRVIRPYPNKKFAAVVDFLDNAAYVKKHSLARRDIYQIEEGFKIIWPQKKKTR